MGSLGASINYLCVSARSSGRTSWNARRFRNDVATLQRCCEQVSATALQTGPRIGLLDTRHSTNVTGNGQIAAQARRSREPTMGTEQRDIQDIGCSIAKNVRLLEALQGGTKTKPELADELSVSKSTVYYRFEELNEYDLVGRGPEGYRLTNVGRIITETYLEELGAMRNAYSIRAMLRKVPDEGVPPSNALQSARTVLPDRHPEEVRTEFCEWLHTAEEIRGMVPHASCSLVEFVCAQVETGDLTLDVTLTPESMAYLRENHPEETRTVCDADSTVVRERADLPSFGLVVVDEPWREAGLVVYTDDGYVSGFMQLPTERAHRWATEQLAKYTEERRSHTTPTRVTTD